MCVSSGPVDFTNSKVSQNKPNDTEHVLGYQMTTKILSPGAKAILIHLYVKLGAAFSQDNFLDASNYRHIMDDMVEAARPKMRGGGGERSLSKAASLMFFDLGAFKVVASRNPMEVYEALDRVPEDKRPTLSKDLFEYYVHKKADCWMVLCCFNSNDECQPIVVRYEPRDINTFVFPGLDAHTGEPPVSGAMVERDHWLLASSYKMTEGSEVRYRDQIPSKVREILPNRVKGVEMSGYTRNGDWHLPVAAVESGHYLRPEHFQIVEDYAPKVMR